MPDDEVVRAMREVAAARRAVCRAQAVLAEEAMRYVDARRSSAAAEGTSGDAGRPKPEEFVADELSMVLAEQPWQVRCLLARAGRVQAGLPTVWAAFRAGDLDAVQVQLIDRAARRATEAATLSAIDAAAVGAARHRSPKQLTAALQRLVARCEPFAATQRHRRAMADRGVRVHQGPDGTGYVTGEVAGDDAAAIDATLAAAARRLGADDPRTDQQRRADLFADLLLGRAVFADDLTGTDAAAETAAGTAGKPEDPELLEVEVIDPQTGEVRTRWQPVDAAGEPIGDPSCDRVDPRSARRALIRRPQTVRIGVVVSLSSLLGLDDTPAELADRSAIVPAETIRDRIADASTPSATHAGDRVLFTRLLTDDGGRLLEVTELGRFPSRRLAEAVALRAGTCVFATCTVPAERCDIDHREPVPRGPTRGSHLDPHCRRHHRGRTFAWLATCRYHDDVTWTMPDAETYRVTDPPLPVPRH